MSNGLLAAEAAVLLFVVASLVLCPPLAADGAGDGAYPIVAQLTLGAPCRSLIINGGQRALLQWISLSDNNNNGGKVHQVNLTTGLEIEPLNINDALASASPSYKLPALLLQLTSDAYGTVYVYDNTNKRVFGVNASGQLTAALGPVTSAGLVSLDVSPDGTRFFVTYNLSPGLVFVHDSANWRVLNNFSFPSTLECSGHSRIAFPQPSRGIDSGRFFIVNSSLGGGDSGFDVLSFNVLEMDYQLNLLSSTPTEHLINSFGPFSLGSLLVSRDGRTFAMTGTSQQTANPLCFLRTTGDQRLACVYGTFSYLAPLAMDGDGNAAALGFDGISVTVYAMQSPESSSASSSTARAFSASSSSSFSSLSSSSSSMCPCACPPEPVSSESGQVLSTVLLVLLVLGGAGLGAIALLIIQRVHAAYRIRLLSEKKTAVGAAPDDLTTPMMTHMLKCVADSM